jgi:hypothetical protein
MLKSTTVRIALVIAVVLLLIGLGLALQAKPPGDDSASCAEYYAEMENPPAAALEWCEAGEYFSLESTLPVNEDFNALNIFHICQGNPDDPAILMIHGYPTMSFDYAPLFNKLKMISMSLRWTPPAMCSPINPWMDMIIPLTMMPTWWMNISGKSSA